MKKLLAALIALTLALAGCSKGSPDSGGPRLPEGRDLLQRSADAMAKLRTVAFTLDIEGPIGVFSIKDADGVLTSEGKAKATAHLNQGGRLVEYQYVQVAGQAYLKGPTGGFQPVSPTLAARFFDPTALLTGDKSLSKGLAQSTDARTEAEEKVAGVDSYRVHAKVDPNKVAGLSLMATGAVDDAQLYIAKDTDQLVKAVLPFSVPKVKEKTVITVTFKDFDKDVQIDAPA